MINYTRMQKQFFLLFSLHIISVFGLSALSDTNVPNRGNDVVKKSTAADAFLGDQPLNSFHVIVKRDLKAIHRSKRRTNGDRRRRKRREQVSEPDYKEQSTYKNEKTGVLQSDTISANGIQATSMVADKIVADIIHAKTIYGRNIVVVSKRSRRPDMSEFMTSQDTKSKPNAVMGSNRYRYRQSKESATRTKTKHVSVRDGRVQRTSGNNRSPTYAFRKHDNVKKYPERKTNRDHNYRRKRVQKRPPSFGKDPYGTVVDTWRHPVIAFQNGYVRRKRIRTPKKRI